MVVILADVGSRVECRLDCPCRSPGGLRCERPGEVDGCDFFVEVAQDLRQFIAEIPLLRFRLLPRLQPQVLRSA